MPARTQPQASISHFHIWPETKASSISHCLYCIRRMKSNFPFARHHPWEIVRNAIVFERMQGLRTPKTKNKKSIFRCRLAEEASSTTTTHPISPRKNFVFVFGLLGVWARKSCHWYGKGSGVVEGQVDTYRFDFPSSIGTWKLCGTSYMHILGFIWSVSALQFFLS